MMLRKIVILSILFLFTISSFKAQDKTKTKPIPEPSPTYYFQLTNKEVSDLEAKLKTAPADFEARTELIGYYSERETPVNNKILQRHRLALIENNPEDTTATHLNVWFQDEHIKPEFIAMKNAWLKKIALNTKNKEIRFQAASFLEYDPILAEKILLDGKALAPGDFEYSVKLVEFYDASIPNTYGESEESRFTKKTAVLKKIVAEATKTLALAKKAEDSELTQTVIPKTLAIAAKYSLEMESLDAAKNFADQLIINLGDPKLLTSTYLESEIDYFQIANSVLGRIALRAGNIEKAKEFLFSSINLIDDENNKGPKIDVPFLQEMLVRNGSKNVIEYLELFNESTSLEDSDRATILEMITVMNRGRFPNFDGFTSIY